LSPSTPVPYTTLFRSCRVQRSVNPHATLPARLPRVPVSVANRGSSWSSSAAASNTRHHHSGLGPHTPAEVTSGKPLRSPPITTRSEEHTSELQSRFDL